MTDEQCYRLLVFFVYGVLTCASFLIAVAVSVSHSSDPVKSVDLLRSSASIAPGLFAFGGLVGFLVHIYCS